MKDKSLKADDPAQSKRFIEAARKAGASETREGADRAFMKVLRSQRRPVHRPKAQSGGGSEHKNDKR